MKHLYTLVLLLILSGTTLFAQEPLTDKIVIEFMKPGDPDAQARNYNLLPWPEEAKAAAYKAAEIWASYLEITVPIRVKFGWCDNIEEFNARGGSTYSYQYTDGYYYPSPLINQLVGYDKNKDVVDIICVFKSYIDIGWYFGTDGEIGLTPDPNDPGIQYFQKDLLTTMLHEICHGLGLTSTMDISNNKGKWGGSISGKANIFDTFIVDKEGKQLINERYYKNNSEELAEALTSNTLYWNGRRSKEETIKIHAPESWKKGNSICHIDSKYAKTENCLMSGVGIEGGNHQHAPGPIVLGMLQDMGWTLKSGATATDKIQLESPIKVYTSGNDIVIEGCEQTDKIMVYDFTGKVRYTGNGSGRVNLPSGLYIIKIADQTYKVRL